MSNIASAANPNQNLYNPQKSPKQLIEIKCNKCGNTDKPHKWNTMYFFGIFCLFTFLFIPVNFFGLLVFFGFANPYICNKCGERNQLIKILNNHEKLSIEGCMSKNKFLWISILFLAIPILLAILLPIIAINNSR